MNLFLLLYIQWLRSCLSSLCSVDDDCMSSLLLAYIDISFPESHSFLVAPVSIFKPWTNLFIFFNCSWFFSPQFSWCSLRVIDSLQFFNCSFHNFSNGVIHFLHRDLYHHHQVGFKVAFFFLCLSNVRLSRACYSEIAWLWWSSIYWLLLFMFLHLHLESWIWSEYHYACHFLNLSLFIGVFLSWFLFPLLSSGCYWLLSHRVTAYV